MVYALAFTMFLLLLANYNIANGDFFNPAVLFSLMNFICSSICIAVCSSYELDFHMNGYLVLTSGVIVFTINNLLINIKSPCEMNRTSNINVYKKLSYIDISNIWLLLFLGFELVTAFFMMKYVKNVSAAYYGRSESIFQSATNYNRILKNFGDELRNLRVPNNVFNTVGWPLCISTNLVFFAVMLNNYFYNKKINILICIDVILMLTMSFITGARSTAFKLIMALAIEFVFYYRLQHRTIKEANRKLASKVIVFGSLGIMLFFASTGWLGRKTDYNPFEYISAYIGTPLLNLDIFLQGSINTSEIWGQETFHNFYAYLGSKFNIEMFRYDLYQPYLYYNGHYLGNVYTMYYMFVEDFGYAGIIPLTLVVSIFYNSIYKKILNSKGDFFIFRFFAFSYMFSSLFTLVFTNRFYEDALRGTALYVYVWLVIVLYCLKHGMFSSGINTRRNPYRTFNI